MEVAKIAVLETASRAGCRMEVGKTRALNLSVKSRNLPFSGKSFYLDLPHNKSSQILTGTIKNLGGVIESFLSRDVMYVVSASKEARRGEGAARRTEWKSNADSTSRGVAEAKPVLSAIAAGSTRLDGPRRPKPENNPALISRGKELLHKAMRKKDGGPSVLANARSWGVHILHVNEVLDYMEKLSLATKNLTSQKTEVAAPRSVAKVRKVAQLRNPFLKIEDQSRHFRPLHHHFQSFPALNLLAARGCSLFELTKSPRSSCKDRDSKAKAVNADGFLTHSEAERSPKTKHTPEERTTMSKRTPEERTPKTKRTPAAKKTKNGYCECCQQAFEELAMHLQGEQHVRFSQDVAQYALVDHIISLFPCDFAELPPGWSDSRSVAVPTSAAADVDHRCHGNDVHMSDEVKVCLTGLDMPKNCTTVDEYRKPLSDGLHGNVTCDEKGKEGGDVPTSDTEGGRLADHPSLPPAQELSCPKAKTEGRKKISFRTLLESGEALSGKEQTGCNMEGAVSQIKSGICSPDGLNFGKNTGPITSAASDTGLVSSAGEGLQVCRYTDSAVLGEKICRLRQACEGIVPMCLDPNEASSDRKRKRSSEQSPQSVKRRVVRPGGCSSGPVSPSNQQNGDSLDLAFVEEKLVLVPSTAEEALAGSMQTSVMECLGHLSTVPCRSATPLSVEPRHALPRDLQHYEQLLGHWECFSPRVDVHQGMPSEMTGSRDYWDVHPVTPSGHKPLERDLSFLCGIDGPMLNELSSTWCKVQRSGGQSVLQELQNMERKLLTPSPSHFCPSGCSVSLTFQELPQNTSTEGTADTPCRSVAHVSTLDVKNGMGLLPAESFSSVSDWDVQLLSRVDNLHAVKDPALDVEVLRRTSVSMRDTSYESHLCSVLKPKSELDWTLKEERGRVNYWADTEGIPFNMFEACLSGWTS